MELETLFTDQKWNILSLLSKEHLSPLQLSEKSNTTMANISQQLRLLEASSLVGKRKIPNRDRGKPRTLFHLMRDRAYLINVSEGSAQKKLIDVNPLHKAIMGIWFVPDTSAHYFLQKWYWKIESQLNQVEAVVIDASAYPAKGDLPVIVLAKNDMKKWSAEIRDNEGKKRSVKVQTLKDLKSVKADSAIILYDPKQKAAQALRGGQ